MTNPAPAMMPADPDNDGDTGMERYCPNCGYELDDGDETCPECGVDVADVDCDMPQEKVLGAKARKALPASSFLYVSPEGKRMFPVPDEEHIRKAIQLLPRADLPAAVKARIRAKLKRLAKKHGIEMSEAKQETTNTRTELIENTYSVPVITEAIDAQGNKYHTGRLLVSVADKVNRNNRLYPSAVWQREAVKAVTKVGGGLLTGQAEHPLRPQLLDTFLKFTGVHYDSKAKTVYADFSVIPTTKGEDFVKIAKAGVAIGCSTRGAGSVKREKVEGKDVDIIQEDYELAAIDVMLLGQQSVESARLVQFEHLEEPQPEIETEQHMAEIKSVDALREAHPDLVAEVEKPLNEQLAAANAKAAQLETEVQALKESDQVAKTLLTEVRALLTVAEDGSVTEAVKALQIERNQAVAEVKQATERDEAFRFVVESARDVPRGGWLLVEHLKGVKTKAEAEAEFPRVKKLAESLIETALLGTGAQVAQPQDLELSEKPTASVAEQNQPEIEFPTALSVATGTRIPPK